MDISSNRLLPVFGTLAVAMTVFIGLKSCQSHTPAAPTLTAVPKAPAVDADSPSDTLRALTAQVAHMKQEAEQLRKSNEDVLQQKNDLSAKIKQELRQESQAQHDSALSDMMKRLDELSNRMPATNNGSLVPTATLDTRIEPKSFESPSPPSTIRIEPLNASGLLEKLGTTFTGLKDKTTGSLNDIGHTGGSLLQGLETNSVVSSHVPSTSHPSGMDTANLPEPVYTVPRNSTLMGSTGMTALIGRIPFKGHVDDPYPFKILVGSENLAANGLDIPGIDGMVFTGDALGDWSLSCVRGQIHSVTFVFEDGTIRTLSSDDQSLQQKNQQAAQASGQTNTSPSNGSHKALGWISDRRGIPCITGTRISNAPEYLGGRFLARAIGAAGSAYARSQTTVTGSPLTGGSTSSVTGNANQYALGSLAAGSADELSQWIAERQAQSYDAVFVDTGAEIALHIDQELLIDFEPYGRKLAYARKKRSTGHHVAQLD